NWICKVFAAPTELQGSSRSLKKPEIRTQISLASALLYQTFGWSNGADRGYTTSSYCCNQAVPFVQRTHSRIRPALPIVRRKPIYAENHFSRRCPRAARFHVGQPTGLSSQAPRGVERDQLELRRSQLRPLRHWYLRHWHLRHRHLRRWYLQRYGRQAFEPSCFGPGSVGSGHDGERPGHRSSY